MNANTFQPRRALLRLLSAALAVTLALAAAGPAYAAVPANDDFDSAAPLTFAAVLNWRSNVFARFRVG